MQIPEYIEGIPTEKKESRKRREIIKREYIHLIEKLQNTRGKKAVYNHYLQTDVYIIMRESEKKASNSAAFNWQSTYAVRHLEEVIMKKHPVIKSSSLLAIACTECIQSELLRGLLSGISRPTVEVHRTLHNLKECVRFRTSTKKQLTRLICFADLLSACFSARKITTFLQIKAVSPKKTRKNKENDKQ